MSVSLRASLLACCIFFVLTIASVIYSRGEITGNPYAPQGVVASTLAAAASHDDREAHRATMFWWREGGALLIAGLFFIAVGIRRSP